VFVELMPLLAGRTVLITVAKVDDKPLASRRLFAPIGCHRKRNLYRRSPSQLLVSHTVRRKPLR
jgi:hypothetical protein